MNKLTVVSLVAAFAVANAGEPILRGPSGIITSHGPIGPEGLGLGLGAEPILKGPSGIITSAGPIGPSELRGLGGLDNGLDGRSILKGPSSIITARGPIGSRGEIAGHGDLEGAILLDNDGLNGHLGIGLGRLGLGLGAKRLGLSLGYGRIGLIDGRLGLGDGRIDLIKGRLGLGDGRLGLIDGRLGLADGRIGLVGLKSIEGSGLEGQYVQDLNEKLYDDGSYRPDINGH